MGTSTVKPLFLFTILVLPLLYPSSSIARLGETEIQCEDRYGFAKKDFAANDKIFPLIKGDGTITRTYLFQGWKIRVGFLDGLAVREEYYKVGGPGRSVLIADYEATAVLDGEKGTGAWQAYGPKLSINISKMLQDHLKAMLLGPVWIRSDGTATATKDGAGMHMAFESLAAVQHDEEAKRGNEEKQRASVPSF